MVHCIGYCPDHLLKCLMMWGFVFQRGAHKHTTNRLHGDALIMAYTIRDPRQPVCMTHFATLSEKIIATPAYGSPTGAASPVMKCLFGRKLPLSCVSLSAGMSYSNCVHHRDIRNRVLTNQRDSSYVYAVVSLAADGHFVGGHIVTYIFSRVSVRACVYGKGIVTSHLWLNIA